MHKRVIVILTFLTVILIQVLFLPAQVFAYSPFLTYTYDVNGDPKELDVAYTVSRVVYGTDFGLSTFSDINGLLYKNDKLYVCDSGNDRIVVLDSQLKLERVIKEFSHDGAADSLKYPMDIAVASNGDLYVTDNKNQRIVIFNENGEYLSSITEAKSNLLSKDFVFRPTKIVLDNTDSLYVVATGVTLGIINMDKEGNVISFLGAARVSFDPVLYLRKLLATKEQAAQLMRIVPTEYNNIYINQKGFIYGTINVISQIQLKSFINGNLYLVNGASISSMSESLLAKIGGLLNISFAQTGQNDVVKKLNMKGEDILRRSGYYPVVGEIQFQVSVAGNDPLEGPSRFVDVVVHPNGNYSVLDQKRSRIFTYDDNGVLLFSFGGSGDNFGLYRRPTAIELMGDELVVADSLKGTITFLKPTEFATCVYQATEAYLSGQYETSKVNWQKSIQLSSNFSVGYIGMGRIFLRTGNYAEAMRYFKLGEYREGYDKAFELNRQQILRQVLAYTIVAIVLLYVLRVIWKRYRRKSSHTKDQGGPGYVD
jgi:DNA-binding beta-propeller fold protein YncE